MGAVESQVNKAVPPFYPKTSFSFIRVASCFESAFFRGLATVPTEMILDSALMCATPAHPGAFRIC